MADSSLLMPGADEEYRSSRDRLRAAEIELRDRIEAVGGALEVTGRRGRGTSVRGRVPVD